MNEAQVKDKQPSRQNDDGILLIEKPFTGIVDKSLNIAAAVNTAGTYYLGVIQNVTKEKKEKSETVTFEGLIGAMNKEW